jgi:hypothetical protein
MPIILRDVPPGYNWGWYAREDPRMHVQTVDRKHRNEYKLWPEERGKPVIQPAGPVPAKVLKKVQSEVDKKRASIEAEWVHWMIELGWLILKVDGTLVTLTAYPNTPNRFDRVINLEDYVGTLVAAKIRPDDVRLNSEFAVIEIWPQKPETRRPFIELGPVLWQR